MTLCFLQIKTYFFHLWFETSTFLQLCYKCIPEGIKIWPNSLQINTSIKPWVNFTNPLMQSANEPAHNVWLKNMPVSFTDKTAHKCMELEVRPNYERYVPVSLRAQKLLVKWWWSRHWLHWRDQQLHNNKCLTDTWQGLVLSVKLNFKHKIFFQPCTMHCYIWVTLNCLSKFD